MSDLFNDDRAGGERRLLCIVTSQGETFGLVLDHVGGDGWVVRDLFDHKRRTSPIIQVRPVSVKKFTEDRIEGSKKRECEIKSVPEE